MYTQGGIVFCVIAYRQSDAGWWGVGVQASLPSNNKKIGLKALPFSVFKGKPFNVGIPMHASELVPVFVYVCALYLHAWRPWPRPDARWRGKRKWA